jgi:ABC-type phosphate transport system substrate-binding protein
MRKISRLVTGLTTVAAAAAMVAGTVTTASAVMAAPADPTKAPAPYDIVGVGSSTTQFVMDAIAAGYDAGVKTPAAAHPDVFSFDAWKPGTDPNSVTKISPKIGCASIVRPATSGSGLKALEGTQVIKVGKASFPCINYARSSGARKPTDPKKAAGGVVFVAFAKDAISWATRSAIHGGSDAPASLTLAQLKGIFGCTLTNWKQVGGKSAPIKAYLPHSGSGTLNTFLKIIGNTTGNPASCVSQAVGTVGIEENEGVNKVYNSPNAIGIFSVGAFISQKYHSALCDKKPVGPQNKFGCNETGYLTVGKIAGISPLTTAKVPVINPKFPAAFYRTLYNVVDFNASTKDDIGKLLEGMFGAKSAKGYLCTSKVANLTITDYGFIPTPLCGSTS